MDHPQRLRWTSASARTAAVTWTIGGTMYFVLEAVVARAFRPAYSYAHNYISDLGVPAALDQAGRPTGSTLAIVMNANFILHGLLFLLAGIGIVRAVPSVGPFVRAVFLGLVATNAIGNLLVGAFSSASPLRVTDSLSWHTLGAGLAIVSGNATIIVAGLNARRIGASRTFGTFSVGIGALGILSLVMLGVDAGSSTLNLLPDGLWERASADSIMVWEIVAGLALLRSDRRSR